MLSEVMMALKGVSYSNVLMMEKVGHPPSPKPLSPIGPNVDSHYLVNSAIFLIL